MKNPSPRACFKPITLCVNAQSQVSENKLVASVRSFVGAISQLIWDFTKINRIWADNSTSTCFGVEPKKLFVTPRYPKGYYYTLSLDSPLVLAGKLQLDEFPYSTKLYYSSAESYALELVSNHFEIALFVASHDKAAEAAESEPGTLCITDGINAQKYGLNVHKILLAQPCREHWDF